MKINTDFLSVKDITLVERMKEMGINPLYLAIGVYSIWYIAITLFAYISNSGSQFWIGRTCDIILPIKLGNFEMVFGSECVNPWEVWWWQRLVAEIIWCVPFIAMIILNPKVRKAGIEICEQFKLNSEEMKDAKRNVPNIMIRKWIFRLYIILFFTWGTFTHFDVISFGVIGLLILWPVYLLQGILIADTVSLLFVIKTVILQREKIRLEPFEPTGTAGIDNLAQNLSLLGSVPFWFSIVLIGRSYIFFFMGGGEESLVRSFGEVGIAMGLLAIAFALSAGPLFIMENSVTKRKENAIEMLAGRQNLRDIDVDSVLDVELNESKVADMILIERIQDIETVSSNTVVKIVYKLGIPALLAVLRPLLGLV